MSNTLAFPELINWPPAFTLKHKPHIRRVGLRVCSERGLILTVPLRFTAKDIDSLLLKHREWIIKSLHRMQPCRPQEEGLQLPEEIYFNSVTKSWKIHYQLHPGKSLTLKSLRPQELLFFGETNNYRGVQALLHQWLQREAQRYLIPWLQELGKKTKLEFAGACIRKARTRWGSCSSNKTISLNYKLLFLPAHLVEYVLIHELCHTVHFDHSPKFWQLLEKLNPDCQKNRKELKKGHTFIPYFLACDPNSLSI